MFTSRTATIVQDEAVALVADDLLNDFETERQRQITRR
jgi:hypothetical protein